MAQLQNYIDGKFRPSVATESIPVINPANQVLLTEAPLTTSYEIERAVMAAQVAFEAWRSVPAPERARCLMRYQMILKEKLLYRLHQ